MTSKKPDKRESGLVIICVSVVVLAAALFALLLPGLRKDEPAEEQGHPEFETKEEKYEYYVGPADCEDRGDWVDVIDYYGLFEDDGKENNLARALYRNDEKKGIVPSGVRIEPVLLSYDDFEPYRGPMERGFLDIYAADGPEEPVETQLGIVCDGLAVSGSYDVDKDGKRYTGEIQLDMKDLTYYLVDKFNADAEDDSGYDLAEDVMYGYLEPYFNFNFLGSARSCEYDEAGNLVGIMDIAFDGNLEEGAWNFTADISGQLNQVFKNGIVYIRCKLPCQVTKTVAGENGQMGAPETYQSVVNIYFAVSEIRVGTWMDCMPKL